MTVISQSTDQRDLESAIETTFAQIHEVRRQIEADDADIARLRSETRELQAIIRQQEQRAVQQRQEMATLMQELFPKPTFVKGL